MNETEHKINEGHLRWVLSMLENGNELFGEAFRLTMSYEYLEKARRQGIDPDLIDRIEAHLTANEL